MEGIEINNLLKIIAFNLIEQYNDFHGRTQITYTYVLSKLLTAMTCFCIFSYYLLHKLNYPLQLFLSPCLTKILLYMYEK